MNKSNQDTGKLKELKKQKEGANNNNKLVISLKSLEGKKLRLFSRSSVNSGDPQVA